MKLLYLTILGVLIMATNIYAIACGEGVAVDTNLSADLICNGAVTALKLNVTGVTLDCLGFNIRGDNNAASIGVDSTLGTNTVLKNCNISFFNQNIITASSVSATMYNNTVINNGSGNGIVISSFTTAANVSHNTIITNSGISLSSVVANFNADNNVIESENIGLSLVLTSFTRLKYNNITTKGVALSIVGANTINATGNNINSTENDAIQFGTFFIDPDSHIFINNTITSHSLKAISMTNGGNNTFTENNIISHGKDNTVSTANTRNDIWTNNIINQTNSTSSKSAFSFTSATDDFNTFVNNIFRGDNGGFFGGFFVDNLNFTGNTFIGTGGVNIGLDDSVYSNNTAIAKGNFGGCLFASALRTNFTNNKCINEGTGVGFTFSVTANDNTVRNLFTNGTTGLTINNGDRNKFINVTSLGTSSVGTLIENGADNNLFINLTSISSGTNGVNVVNSFNTKFNNSFFNGTVTATYIEIGDGTIITNSIFQGTYFLDTFSINNVIINSSIKPIFATGHILSDITTSNVVVYDYTRANVTTQFGLPINDSFVVSKDNLNVICINESTGEDEFTEWNVCREFDFGVLSPFFLRPYINYTVNATHDDFNTNTITWNISLEDTRNIQLSINDTCRFVGGTYNAPCNCNESDIDILGNNIKIEGTGRYEGNLSNFGNLTVLGVGGQCIAWIAK